MREHEGESEIGEPWGQNVLSVIRQLLCPSLRETSIYCRTGCSTSLRMYAQAPVSESPPRRSARPSSPAAGKCEDQQNRVGNSHHQVNEPIHEMIQLCGAGSRRHPNNKGDYRSLPRKATVPTMMLIESP